MLTIELEPKRILELLAAGKIHFNEYDLYRIDWISYFRQIALKHDQRSGNFELVELKRKEK